MTHAKPASFTPRPISPRSFGPEKRSQGVINRAKQTQFHNDQNRVKIMYGNDLQGFHPHSHRAQTNPNKANRPRRPERNRTDLRSDPGRQRARARAARALVLSSIAPSKANLWRSWPRNAGRSKKQSQFPAGRDCATSRCITWRTTAGFCFIRPAAMATLGISASVNAFCG